MEKNLKEIYQSNIDKYELLKNRISKRISLISWLRLMIFLLALVLLYSFVQQVSPLSLVIILLIPTLIFFSLVTYHSRIINRKKMIDAYLKVNENELNALDFNLNQLEDGHEFIDSAHQFASDLDVFGNGSLFQYINRTATSIGKFRLADYLKEPNLDKNDILENQEAISELSKDIAWRQNFQAIGIVYHDSIEYKKKIIDWMNERPIFTHPIYKILVAGITIITSLVLGMVIYGVLPEKILSLYLLIPLGIAGLNSRKISRRHIMVGKTSEMLVKYAHLVNEIEQMDFNSKKLKNLKFKLSKRDNTAGNNIKKLAKILNALDHRLGFFSWILLNGLFLWDILQIIRLEDWRKKNKSLIIDCFDVIEEVDALLSFAAFDFNHPECTYPIPKEVDYVVFATNAGHPLIPQKSRVYNNIQIRRDQFLIVTGANMAGKSTYLRTVGVNFLLAKCGAPVIAKEFRFNPIDLYTSIRTDDSLQKNESYFYSELKNLKNIIEVIKSGKKLFVILDEILKGTNSKDKHSGSEALLKQFVSLKTCGIVATHDIALGNLQNIFPDHISNRCFEVDIQGDRLFFDYKLREGVSQNMNATILMRNMGITV